MPPRWLTKERLAELEADPIGWDGVIGKHEFVRLCKMAVLAYVLLDALEYCAKWNGDFRAARDRARNIIKKVNTLPPAPKQD